MKKGSASSPAQSFRKPLVWLEGDGFPKGFSTKAGLAQMLQRGVIMDVINVEQALIAQEAGAVAVMALERVPADIRADGGVVRLVAFHVPSFSLLVAGPHERPGHDHPDQKGGDHPGALF
jgi:hypothetical protein